MKKFLVVPVVLFVLVIGYYAYNADAVYGQYVFNKLCEKEGGSRFYKPVEKGAGWLADSVVTENDKKHLNLVADEKYGFLRFRTEDGALLDGHLKSLPPRGTRREVIDSNEFTQIEPANLTIQPRYTRKMIRTDLHPNPDFLASQSFTRVQRLIIDLQTGEVVATHTGIGYAWTRPDRVLLNAPTAVTCHIGTDDDKSFEQRSFLTGAR